jgi:type 1 fimbria pilin
MKAPAVLSMVLGLLTAGTALAAAAGSAVTLQPSTLSFKQAMSACSGSLGSITFTLGHSRVASLPGVSDETDTSSAGIDTVTFSDDKTGKTAVAKANGHNNSVMAKNVQVKWKNQLACINPD